MNREVGGCHGICALHVYVNPSIEAILRLPWARAMAEGGEQANASHRGSKLSAEERAALISQLREMGATEIKNETGKTVYWQLKFGPKVTARTLPFAVVRQQKALANPDEFKPRSKADWVVPEQLTSDGWKFEREKGKALLVRDGADGQDCLRLKSGQDMMAAVSNWQLLQEQKAKREQAKRTRAEKEAAVKVKIQKIRERRQPLVRVKSEPERDPPLPRRADSVQDGEPDSEDSEEDPRELLVRALDTIEEEDISRLRLTVPQMQKLKAITAGAKVKMQPKAKSTARQDVIKSNLPLLCINGQPLEIFPGVEFKPATAGMSIQEVPDNKENTPLKMFEYHEFKHDSCLQSLSGDGASSQCFHAGVRGCHAEWH